MASRYDFNAGRLNSGASLASGAIQDAGYGLEDKPAGMSDADWERQRLLHTYSGEGGVNYLGYGQGMYDTADIDRANTFGDRATQGLAQTYNDYGAKGSLASAAGWMQQQNPYQAAATAQLAQAANGGPTVASSLAQQSLQGGAASNMAVAGSALGGSLGQAAALRQAAQGQAGYMAQGNQQIAALQAQEQAAAQQAYAQQLDQVRATQQAGMQANTSLAGVQAQSAQNQAQYATNRQQLQDQANSFGQNMAQQMTGSNYAQQQQQSSAQLEGDWLERQRKQAVDNQDSKMLGAGLSTAGSFLGSALKMGSDERMKAPVSLGRAAHMRLWK